MEKEKKRLLIVEDDRVYRYLLENKLKELGYDVTSAENGQEGIKLAHAQTPDLILLDLIMPVKDGFDVLADFQADEVLKDRPVIVLSVLGQEKDISTAKAMGADDYIIKSTVSFDEAIKRITGFLR